MFWNLLRKPQPERWLTLISLFNEGHSGVCVCVVSACLLGVSVLPLWARRLPSTVYRQADSLVESKIARNVFVFALLPASRFWFTFCPKLHDGWNISTKATALRVRYVVTDCRATDMNTLIYKGSLRLWFGFVLAVREQLVHLFCCHCSDSSLCHGSAEGRKHVKPFICSLLSKPYCTWQPLNLAFLSLAPPGLDVSLTASASSE